MFSTFTGLIAGLLLAAFLTVMYGEQLTDFARRQLDDGAAQVSQQANPAAGAQATVPVGEALAAPLDIAPVDSGTAGLEMAAADAAAADAAAVGAAAAGAATTATVMEAETSGESTTSGTPATPGLQEGGATLEQRWAEFAASAQGLPSVGSYPWQRCFTRAAASHGLPESLLLAIAAGESNFDPAARSGKDAIGLMQIRWPTTARHLGLHREADLYDPCTNVDAGARYLRELLARYDEDFHLAVAAYNYGPGAVQADAVPEGARWYSHYIYQHLEQVLGEAPSATSELIAPPGNPGAGRDVLMSFTRAHRARDFIAFLSAQVPGLELQQQSESLGRHEVVLLYGSTSERQQALAALRAAGLEDLGPAPANSYHM